MLFIVDPLVIPIERLARMGGSGSALLGFPDTPLYEASNEGATKRGDQAGKPGCICEKAGGEQKSTCNQKTQALYQRCRG